MLYTAFDKTNFSICNLDKKLLCLVLKILHTHIANYPDVHQPGPGYLL